MKNKKAENPGPGIFFWIAVMAITIGLVALLFIYVNRGFTIRYAGLKNLFG